MKVTVESGNPRHQTGSVLPTAAPAHTFADARPGQRKLNFKPACVSRREKMCFVFWFLCVCVWFSRREKQVFRVRVFVCAILFSSPSGGRQRRNSDRSLLPLGPGRGVGLRSAATDCVRGGAREPMRRNQPPVYSCQPLRQHHFFYGADQKKECSFLTCTFFVFPLSLIKVCLI